MNENLYTLLANYPLETMLQTIPTGLFLVDDEKKIVYWNAEAERITGYSQRDAVGQPCSFMQGMPCREECGLFNDDVPKPVVGVTCTIQHKAGYAISLNKNVDLLRDKRGRVIGGIEAFVDITRLVELETDLRSAVQQQTRELELEKATLRALFDGMIDPAYICDPDFHITYANRAMLDIIGEVDERFCYEAIFQHSEPCENCPLTKVLQGKIISEERYLQGTGKIYEVIHSPYPLARNPTHKLGVCRDITERMETRRRLLQTNRELDAFVSTVSHDLRSPLTPMIGFADLLEERYGSLMDEIGHDCLREIKKSAEKMRVLLEDLLALARVGQLKEPDHPIDVRQIAEDVVLECADKVLEHRAQIKIGRLPQIRVPEPLLSDLFRNLVQNALKYAARHDPRIEIEGAQQQGRIRYAVIDHGPGIDVLEREEIFEPFRRGSSVRQMPGTGIGLATVAKIARVYGGDAWAEETPGGGATFVVELSPAEDDLSE